MDLSPDSPPRPRQPAHPDAVWIYDASDPISRLAPSPPGHGRLVTFISRGMLRVPHGAGPPIDSAEATVMRLNRPPSGWAELSQPSVDPLILQPLFTIPHSGLDPQRLWYLFGRAEPFFAQIARNDVTRQFKGTKLQPDSSSSGQILPSRLFQDKKRPRETTTGSNDQAVAAQWKSLLGSARIGAIPCSSLPGLTPEHLTALGSQALVEHLRNLFTDASSPVDILMTTPSTTGPPLPEEIDLTWAQPSFKTSKNRQPVETDRQLRIRDNWLPVINAFLREALDGQPTQLFWVREPELAEFLPPGSSDHILKRSKEKTTSEASNNERTRAGPIGLADFYLLYRREAEASFRIAAVLELKPNAQLRFLAHALLCVLGDSDSGQMRPCRCHPLTTRGSQGVHGKAQHLIHQLLSQMCASAAPLSILMTSFQLLVIERCDADASSTSVDDQKLDLSIHGTAYAAPLPPYLVGNSKAVEAITGACRNGDGTGVFGFAVNTEEHLIARLVSLSLRAAERCDAQARGDDEHRFKPVVPSSLRKALGGGGDRDASGAGAATRSRDHGGEGEGDRSGAAPQAQGGTGDDGGQGQGGATLSSGSAQQGLQASQRPVLRHRMHPFARGSTATAHDGCLTPSGTQGCPYISVPGNCGECLHRRDHTPCIVKLPRGLLYDFLEGEYDEEELQEMRERCEHRLRKEAAVYQSLRPLQGQVIPRFLHSFDSEAPAIGAAHAYEDVGTSLDDEDIFEGLSLSESDVEEVCRTMPDLVKRLHQAGYAHRDIALRNFCASRCSLGPSGQVAEPLIEPRAPSTMVAASAAARPQTPPTSPKTVIGHAAPSTPAEAKGAFSYSPSQLPPTPAMTASSSGSGGRDGQGTGDSSLDSARGQQVQPRGEQEKRRSPVTVRLIDLGHAVDLSQVEQDEADELIRRDLLRVQEAAEEFRELAAEFLA